MEIIEKRIEEIIPYENNPRQNDKAIEAVAKSIKEFGIQQPIVLDKHKCVRNCVHSKGKKRSKQKI